MRGLPDTTINLSDLVWLIEMLQRQPAALDSREQARLCRIARKAGLQEPTPLAGAPGVSRQNGTHFSRYPGKK